MTTNVESDAPEHLLKTKRGEAVTLLEAISEALFEEMSDDDSVFLLGEDIGVYGGAFKVTRGFLDHFGAERVIDTPIAEGQSLRIHNGELLHWFPARRHPKRA